MKLMRVFVLSLALLSAPSFASPNHDELQAKVSIRTVAQGPDRQSSPASAVSGRVLADQGAQTCEQIHASNFESLRIGYELIDVDQVATDVKDYVSTVIMRKAVDYLMSTLKVHRHSVPLRADAGCSDWFGKYSFESSFTCKTAGTPTCGADGVEIPAKYLNSGKFCSKHCSPTYSCSGPSDCYASGAQSCNCNLTAWKDAEEAQSSYCCSNLTATSDSCPSDCSINTVIDYGNGNGVCETCTTSAAGAGAADTDFFAFVTINDTAACGGDVQAYASACVKDQCDRPIFGHVNFCLSKVSLSATDLDGLVSLAVHELVHALAFSSALFPYFRNKDGTPMIPRQADNPTEPVGQTRWTCSSNQMTSWGAGSNRFVDLTVHGMATTADERGISQCPCPFGGVQPSGSCIVPHEPYLRLPVCVLKLKTPKVLEKVREHFDCSTLGGAELENQETSDCVIIGSHWEQRIFLDELMAATAVGSRVFMSQVTLALMEDSGWYEPDYNQADQLVKGVNFGYKQGCAFATAKCVENGATSFPRHWCKSNDARACSLDRTMDKACVVKNYQGPAPTQVSYFDTFTVGSVAETDYCPFYHKTISHHVCTDASSSPVPYFNVNYMREVFGTTSRCLDSTLHGDVQGFTLDAADFAEARPGCFEIECNTANTAYTVKISNLVGSTTELGTCTQDGQTLTTQDLAGHVTCAPPSELCGIPPRKHIAGMAATATTTTKESAAAEGTTMAATTTISTTTHTTSDMGPNAGRVPVAVVVVKIQNVKYDVLMDNPELRSALERAIKVDIAAMAKVSVEDVVVVLTPGSVIVEVIVEATITASKSEAAVSEAAAILESGKETLATTLVSSIVALEGIEVALDGQISSSGLTVLTTTFTATTLEPSLGTKTTLENADISGAKPHCEGGVALMALGFAIIAFVRGSDFCGLPPF